MSEELRRQLEDFFYLEAELLDERRFREWLELMTGDVRYWMPTRHNLPERPDNVAAELSRPDESYYFNDTRETLAVRVERLYSRSAWAELPPSRTRRIIGNVRVKHDDGFEIHADSNFIVYRTRMETDQDLFVGTRKDVLRRLDGTLKIARRTIILDQAVLAAKNISIFL
jgi:3-phenylpropionate/cinnamic acid dioxygenase small subunit